MTDDDRKSKMYQEFTDFINTNLGKPIEAKLSEISPLSAFNDEIRISLMVFYDHTQGEMKRLGTLFNSIYTQQNNVFSITGDLMNDLVTKDDSNTLNSCDWDAHKAMMRRALSAGIFVVLRPPVYRAKGVRSKSGLYELVHPKFLDPLIKMIGQDVCNAKKDAFIKWYDEGPADKRLPLSLDNTIKLPKTEEELRLERSRDERKQSNSKNFGH